MANVPGINGFYSGDIEIKIDNGNSYVKIGDEIVTSDAKEVRLFHRAYTMGRDHKKQEIKKALGI